MAEVFAFPNRDDREWAKLEPAIRQMLYQIGLDTAAADEILADLKRRARNIPYTSDFSIPPSMGREEAIRIAVEFCQQQIHSIVSYMLGQLLELRVALYVEGYRPNNGDDGSRPA